MRGGWTARRGRVLVVGLATLLGALTLAAMAVLPRIGYAAEAFTWTCST
jgi:hypothetical protein